MNEIIIKLLKEKKIYIALILFGIIVFLIPSYTFDNKGEKTEDILKATLEMADGVGDVDVMITYDSENNTEGAIIVAEGAYDTKIRKLLLNSTVAVLGIPTHKVIILTKKQKGDMMYEKN